MAILDKGVGSRRSPAQAARNMEAFKLLNAGRLKKGQLFRIVTGAASPEKKARMPRPVSQDCLDCGQLKTHEGPQLKSQPARCKPCGRKKRNKHWTSAKGK